MFLGSNNGPKQKCRSIDLNKVKLHCMYALCTCKGRGILLSGDLYTSKKKTISPG